MEKAISAGPRDTSEDRPYPLTFGTLRLESWPLDSCLLFIRCASFPLRPLPATVSKFNPLVASSVDDIRLSLAQANALAVSCRKWTAGVCGRVVHKWQSLTSVHSTGSQHGGQETTFFSIITDTAFW